MLDEGQLELIPGTTRSTQMCPKCRGAGTVTCPDCEGTGEVDDNDD
jgi:DnaJ-class molecular chaperone